MNAKHSAAIAIVTLVIIVALVASIATFVSTSPASDVTYQEPTSAVRASTRQTATDGTIALRLNGISDASNPATSSVWVEFSREALASGVYNFSLTPPQGDSYLIANITVTNVHHAAVSFSYAYFVLVSQNDAAYYANYAVCSGDCSAQALKARTLNENFTSDLYVLFSVPAGTQPTKLVYTASSPPIVITLI